MESLALRALKAPVRGDRGGDAGNTGGVATKDATHPSSLRPGWSTLRKAIPGGLAAPPQQAAHVIEILEAHGKRAAKGSGITGYGASSPAPTQAQGRAKW